MLNFKVIHTKKKKLIQTTKVLFLKHISFSKHHPTQNFNHQEPASQRADDVGRQATGVTATSRHAPVGWQPANLHNKPPSSPEWPAALERHHQRGARRPGNRLPPDPRRPWQPSAGTHVDRERLFFLTVKNCKLFKILVLYL